VTEGTEFLYLTTTGRRSGRPREIEIWFTQRGGRHYVIAEHGRGAAWVRNLEAEPRVNVRVGGAAFRARARVIDEGEVVDAVRALSEEKYGWGDGLVVELAHESPADGSAPGARGA